MFVVYVCAWCALYSTIRHNYMSDFRCTVNALYVCHTLCMYCKLCTLSVCDKEKKIETDRNQSEQCKICQLRSFEFQISVENHRINLQRLSCVRNTLTIVFFFCHQIINIIEKKNKILLCSIELLGLSVKFDIFMNVLYLSENNVNMSRRGAYHKYLKYRQISKIPRQTRWNRQKKVIKINSTIFFRVLIVCT